MKSILKELDCFVCYEPLRDPVYLHTCGHSLCLGCSKVLLDPITLSITCPLDKGKTQFRLSQSGEVALPLNRPLMAISEVVIQHLSSCEVCQSRPAVLVCANDLLRLCDSCAHRHTSSKHLKSHTLCSTTSQTICPDHQRRVLWICFTELKLLCCECGEFGEAHRLCQVLTLSRARSRILRVLRKAEKSSEALVREVKDMGEAQELPATLQRQTEELRAGIQALGGGPAAWLQALQQATEVMRCQKAVATAVKQLRRRHASL